MFGKILLSIKINFFFLTYIKLKIKDYLNRRNIKKKLYFDQDLYIKFEI